MKKTTTFLIMLMLFTIGGIAQTTHNVEAGGTPDADTPDPYFSPQFLTINVGDIVVWTNVEGWHSVDGSTDTFPDNPESFSSGDAGSGWTYQFTFNTPGVYDYECPVGSHADTQFGTITVLDIVNSIDEEKAENSVRLYPNPVSTQLQIELKDLVGSFRILDSAGRIVSEGEINDHLTVDVSDYDKGAYLFIAETKDGSLSEQFIVR